MAQPGSLELYIDPVELKSMQEAFAKAPYNIRPFIKKRWRKTGKEAVKQMKASHFSGPLSGNTLRARSKRARAGVKGRALRPTLAVKKVKFGRAGSFGGYVILGFKDAFGNRMNTHTLINIFEFSKGQERFIKSGEFAGKSVGKLRTKAPLESAWNAAKARTDFFKDVSAGIDDWERTKWRPTKDTGGLL